MSFTYIMHELAQKDYEVSLEWYMERSVLAAENFIKAVNTTLSLICDNPTQWRNGYKQCYELGLKNYPFSIIYTVETDKKLVVVTALYHHKRNPRKKYRRI